MQKAFAAGFHAGYGTDKCLTDAAAAQGWAHHLLASRNFLARGFCFFVITVHLTEEGERRVDEIVKCVFQFLELLRGDEDKKEL